MQALEHALTAFIFAATFDQVAAHFDNSRCIHVGAKAGSMATNGTYNLTGPLAWVTHTAALLCKPLSVGCKLCTLPTRIAVVGNYLPRQCGIATFTTDLCNAVAAEFGGDRLLLAIPVNDLESAYDYPKEVRLELEQEELAPAMNGLRSFLNFNGNDLGFAFSMNTVFMAALQASTYLLCCVS